jgi:hypothetical protein
MSRRASFSQTDVTRAIRGAQAAGWPEGSFLVEVGDGIIRLLPVAARAPVASEAGARPASAREALAKWRKSA